MERTPRPPGGEPEQQGRDQSPSRAAESLPGPTAESWDERVIQDGIQAAVAEDRPIDNRTARYIAGQLHGGQASALYALASSGAITDEVMGELVRERAVRETSVRAWIDALIAYCASRPDPDPVAGWIEQAEAQDSGDLFAAIESASVARLGDVATVHATEPPPDEEDDDGRDSFSWGDAARWSPADAAEAAVMDVPGLSAEQLDALFGDGADEEIGDVQDLGWYGLLRWTDQPGGLIVKCDDQGRRQTWVIRSEDVLTARWADITNEYNAFYEQREAYEQVTNDLEHPSSGMAPRIWVGSLADYNNGILHGEWFDATRESEELELATKFMLRGSRMPDAEEWGIFDYDGFAGVEPGEYESFATVSRIANGIAEHGEAFGHWAAYVGSESTDEIDRFEDHYRGEWESFEAYIEDYLQESDFYCFLDEVSEDMRGYIEVDVEQIAQDWEADYLVAELSNGRVAVFETRA